MNQLKRTRQSVHTADDAKGWLQINQKNKRWAPKRSWQRLDQLPAPCRNYVHSVDWTCSDKVESVSSLCCQPLELKRADEVERRVAPDGVLEAVDVATDRVGRLGPALECHAPDEFGLQRLEEGLDHRVVEAISLP